MEETQIEAPIVVCEMCNAENAPMGRLGFLWHYCCRACGWHYSAS